jgi:hypothetical protein
MEVKEVMVMVANALRRLKKPLATVVMACIPPLASAQIAPNDNQLYQLGVTGVSPSGDLLVSVDRGLRVFRADGTLRTPFEYVDSQILNVSNLTGEKVADSVTSWRTGNVDHVAAVSLSGPLLVFVRSPLIATDWRVVNVTELTGKQITGPPTSWQTSDGSVTIDHVAGMNPSGDLVVFARKADNSYVIPATNNPVRDTNLFTNLTLPGSPQWEFVNVTDLTGEKITGPVANWQTPDGPFIIEHLAGASPSGDLLVFFRSHQANWQKVNVTDVTGEKITGPVTSWQTPDGPFNVEHLAGMSPSGDLLVFFWSPQADWQKVNVTGITGAKIVGPVASWITDNVEHLTAAGPDKNLYVFSWRSGADWQVMSAAEWLRTN